MSVSVQQSWTKSWCNKGLLYRAAASQQAFSAMSERVHVDQGSVVFDICHCVCVAAGWEHCKLAQWFLRQHTSRLEATPCRWTGCSTRFLPAASSRPRRSWMPFRDRSACWASAVSCSSCSACCQLDAMGSLAWRALSAATAVDVNDAT